MALDLENDDIINKQLLIANEYIDGAVLTLISECELNKEDAYSLLTSVLTAALLEDMSKQKTVALFQNTINSIDELMGESQPRH